MPHGIARDSGPQAGAALPQSAGEAGGANEEQSERAADGSACTVQPAEGASEEVLCRVATNTEERDAAIDAGAIATEPIDGGSSDGDGSHEPDRRVEDHDHDKSKHAVSLVHRRALRPAWSPAGRTG